MLVFSVYDKSVCFGQKHTKKVYAKEGSIMKAEKTIKYKDLRSGETYTRTSFVDLQFDDEDGYLFWNRKSHVKTFLDIPLPDVFSWSEKGRLGELRKFILKDTQFLAYRSGNVIKPLDEVKVGKSLGMSARQARAFVNKSVKHGVIKRITDGERKFLIFNPLYGMKAKRLSLTVYLLFQDELSGYVPRWVKERFSKQATEVKSSDVGKPVQESAKVGT